MASEDVFDKYEKDEAFRTAFEKWALSKFLQLLFGNDKLPFALPRYGSIEQEDVYFDSGKYGGIWHEDINMTPLPPFLISTWDEEANEWNYDDFYRKLTEQELELLFKYLGKISSSERNQLYEKAKTLGRRK